MKKNQGKRRRARERRREKEAREWAKWERVRDLRRGYSIGLFNRKVILS